MMRIIVLALPSIVALAGCSSAPQLVSLMTPYRIDVRQGTFVTPQMVSPLKAGQSRDQVRFILGTPLIADPFHADRWDYVYRFQPGHGDAEQRRLEVYFADGKLARFVGDIPNDPSPASAQSADRVIEIGPRGAPAPADASKPQAGT